MPAQSNQSQNIALIKQDITYIKESVREISDQVRSGYTPIGDFNTLKARVDSVHKTLAYLASLVALGLIAALLRLVLR